MARLTIGAALLGSATLFSAAPAMSATEIEMWHALGGVLGERVQELAKMFNESQSDYVINPVHKGSYDEVVNGMIAAYRAKQHPAIVQVNERAFLTMVYSGATLSVAKLMEDKGYNIDWSTIIAPIANYYTMDGEMKSMPFNSSTPILWYNVDHFTAAGYPEGPADTWDAFEAQIREIKEKGISQCGSVLPGDYDWSFMEQYAAINDYEWASKQNGFEGLDTQFTFNTVMERQLTRMAGLVQDDVLQIAGQGILPIQLFTSGTCSTILASTASHATVIATATVNWNATYLPHEEDRVAHNSVLGGGALWALQGHSDETYDGVAAFFNFLAQNETQVWWHKVTGYVPVTTTAYDTAKADGYYTESPTSEIAVLQMMREPHSRNSLGIRLGNSNQANRLMMEEFMAAMLGQKSVKDALDAAVARGDEVLRRYEQLNAGK